jgi:hypothetical protein
MIILKWIFKKLYGDIDCIGLTQDRTGGECL